MLKENFKIAKPLLQNIPLFHFLSKNQLNSFAYAMNSLHYAKKEEIFKEGDDANSFFIIVEGAVEINVPNKPAIFLKEG